MVDQKRLAQVLSMLGSAFDGEVLNAGRLAHKMVHAAGITWEEVLSGGGYNEEFVRKVAEEAYAKGKIDGAPKPKANTFADYAQLLLDEHDLTDWEFDFLSSWTEGRWVSPSEKQLAVFLRLAKKFGEPIPDVDESWDEVK